VIIERDLISDIRIEAVERIKESGKDRGENERGGGERERERERDKRGFLGS
jgi:hypothetical protein